MNNKMSDLEIRGQRQAELAIESSIKRNEKALQGVEENLKSLLSSGSKPTSLQQESDRATKIKTLKEKAEYLKKIIEDNKEYLAELNGFSYNTNSDPNSVLPNTNSDPNSVLPDPNSVLPDPNSDPNHLKLLQNLIATINPYESVQPSSPIYKGEDFLNGGEQFLYEMARKKAAEGGKESEEAFMYKSDSIRPKINEYTNSPAMRALIQVAAQQGLNSEQIFSLIFNDFGYNQNNIGPDGFDADAKGTLTGINQILDGNYEAKDAARIINRLGLARQKQEFRNTLMQALNIRK